MTEPAPPPERIWAARVCAGLQRMRLDLEAGRAVSPSALSMCMRKARPRNVLLFLWMANQAVARKYQTTGRADVVAALALASARFEADFHRTERTVDSAMAAGADEHPLDRFVRCRKRISHYQSRWIDTDLDLVLCAQGTHTLDRGLTAWVCQQPDLRYRWTGHGLARIAYLADCWEAYAHCNFSWNDRFIGLSAFPLHQARTENPSI